MIQRTLFSLLTVATLAVALIAILLTGGADHLNRNIGLLSVGRAIESADGLAGLSADSADLANAVSRLQNVAPSSVSSAPQRALGFAALALGDQTTALEAWRQDPDAAATFFQYGDIARQQTDYAEAVKWFGQAYLIEPLTLEYGYNTGLMYERMGDWESAETTYRDVLALLPAGTQGVSDIHYHIGQIYQWQIDTPDFAVAADAYRAAIEQDAYLDTATTADAHYRLGEVRQWSADADGLSEAVTAFQQAVDLDPTHHWAHLRLADASFKLDGDFAAVEPLLVIALERWPDDSSRTWYFQTAASLYLAAERPDAAVAALRDAISADSNNQQAQTMLESLTQN